MDQRANRVLLILSAAFAGLVLAAGVALAAQPKAGKYHWENCSKLGGSTCVPTEQVDFTVKKATSAKGATSKIKNFSYNNGFTCAKVTVGKSIKVKGDGTFHFSGSGKDPTGQKIPLTIDGTFVSGKKAKGTIVINAGCQTATPVKFTAKHVK